jgi:hypothetical protein
VPMPIGVVEDLMDRAGPDGVVETRTHGQDRFRRNQHLGPVTAKLCKMAI